MKVKGWRKEGKEGEMGRGMEGKREEGLLFYFSFSSKPTELAWYIV